MSTLTRPQALELAKSFKVTALAVGEKTVSSWDQLSPKERDELNSLEWSLFNASEDMLTLATALALDDLQGTLDQIKSATKKAQNAVKKINNIRAVLTVAGAAVSLAASVLSKDPSAIFNGLKDLGEETVKAVKEWKTGGQ